MLCNRCNKRPAIIFVQRMDGANKGEQQGLCLRCAREMHLKPVDDLMKQFGMTEQDMDAMEERMDQLMEEMGGADMNPLELMMNMNQGQHLLKQMH